MLVSQSPASARCATRSLRRAFLGQAASIPGWLLALACMALVALSAGARAQQGAAPEPNKLTSVDYSVGAGNRIELRFEFSGPPQQPRAFVVRDPARIAIDFPGTANATDKRRVSIDVGLANSLNLVEAQNQTRAVVNLTDVPEYDTRVEGSSFILTVGAPSSRGGASQRTVSTGQGSTKAGNAQSGGDQAATSGLESVDFRRGEQGEGRVVVELASSEVPVDVQQRGGRIVVDLPGVTIAQDKRRRLDVLDFDTPVKYIDIEQRGDSGRVRITPRDQRFRQTAYQSGSRLTVAVRPLTQAEIEQREQEQKDEYTGDKLSLNFQDIEVRSVLQLLADFTGLNVVVSDSVQGSVTLRLKEVPWDQALDIILRSKGLDKRRKGNVIFVAPREEIAAREQARLEAQKKQEELAPLRNEYIQVNYAKAADLAEIVKSENTNLLSERGKVSVDERTNTLLVRATGDNLRRVRDLVQRLDVSVRQVMIESRIVVANNDFSKELGVRFGVNRDTTNVSQGDGTGAVVSGNADGVQQLVDDEEIEDGRYNVNLPASSATGSVGLALAKLPLGTFLELELSALQAEGRGEVISEPRVVTANQNEARIEQGVEIPYTQASSSGATSVTFQKAVLALEVQPQITPDNRIIMDLTVNKDSVGQVFSGIPSVDTQEVETRVVVDNGETVVLGGVYERSKRTDIERVPFFGELPVLGHLFRTKRQEDNKSELLVFVTPKIVKDGVTATQY